MGICNTKDTIYDDDEVGYRDHQSRTLKMPAEPPNGELSPPIITSARHQVRSTPCCVPPPRQCTHFGRAATSLQR